MEGFETFFEDNYGDVLRSVAFALGDRDRAEDLTQEAFARAYQRWGRVAAMHARVYRGVLGMRRGNGTG